MSKPVRVVPDMSKADAALAAAREALADGRPKDAMLAIGRADAEHRSAMRAAELQFRAVLAPLARQATRAAMPRVSRRSLH
ncbi:MAG: hypothetical protein HYV09_03545 [Deltaproteobacteria bacterium]|nr:hypothetical protein [Deltaproteobacteria bacterium]